jgi:hypothetical protein
MQISGCGYACSEWVLKENGVSSSCSMENEIEDVCPIRIGLKEKNLETCLKCPERYKNGKICETYSNGMRHCPLRIGVLTK